MMKKIMKKVMSLALVVMMVLSLAPMTAFADEPVGSAGNPEVLEFEGTYTCKSAEVTTTNAPYYCKVVAPADGVISVGGYAHSADWVEDLEYKLVVGNAEPVIGTGYIEGQNVEVSEGETVIFNYSLMEAGLIDVDVYFFAVGTEANPESIVIGDYSATFVEWANNYYYEWVATGNGIATVTINTEDCLNGWQYQVNNITKDAYNVPNSSLEGAATQEIVVSVGDVVQININTCGEESMYDTPAGTVNWTLSFTEDNSNPDPEPEPEPEPEEYELGHYMNPYQLGAQGPALPVTIAPGTEAYIQPSVINNKVVEMYAMTDTWFVVYGRQSVYPNAVDDAFTASLELNPMGDRFSVYNNGEEAITVSVRLVDATPMDTTGTMNDPEILELEEQAGGVVGTNIQQDIAAGSEGYFYEWTATAEGKVTFKILGAVDSQGNDFGWLYCFSNVSDYKYGDTIWSDSDPVVTTVTYDVEEGDIITLVVSTYNESAPYATPAGTVFGTLIFEEKEAEEDDNLDKDYVSPESGDGSDETPFVIKNLGLYLAAKSDVNVYYKWVATDNGVLTITISEEDAKAYKSAYVYTINGEPVDRELGAAVNTNEVKKGDVVIIATYPGTKALEFDVAFAAGAKVDKDTTEKPATNANDKQNYTEIVTGTVKLDTTVVTTLFVLTPDKVGKYTVTAPAGVKVEDWNAPSYPNNLTTNATNTVTINCTAVGQSFLVGITAAESVDKVDVNVTYTAVAQKDEVAWTVYKNTATISKFETVLTGFEYVDVEDKVVDKAVLGKDGFYHLNSVNGPILYVDLDDELMSLYAAADLGQLVEYVKENGEVVARYNYSEAVKEYYEAANKDGMYPLTTDLVTILQRAGAYKEWYGANGALGFTEADAWMFACYYVPGSEDKDADNTVVAPLPTPEAGKEEADVIVDKEYLNEYIEQAIADKTPLELPTTNENVSMTFDPSDLKDADKIELNLTVNVVEDAKDETVAKNDKITDKNFVLKVEFSHDGELPGEAVISIQVPATIAEKYEKLFYYQIMADGSLKFVCDAPVVDGVAKVTQDHCSDYVLLTEKVIEAPATGDSTNVALWFAILALGALAIAGSVVMRKKEF